MTATRVVCFMASAALLHHELPGGEAHFDLLLERAPEDAPGEWSPPDQAKIRDPDERFLIAFRVVRRLAIVATGDSVAATRLPDHRARYLAYEGALSQDRGVVSRDAVGELRGLKEAAARITCEIRWLDDVHQRLVIERVQGDAWRICVND